MKERSGVLHVLQGFGPSRDRKKQNVRDAGLSGELHGLIPGLQRSEAPAGKPIRPETRSDQDNVKPRSSELGFTSKIVPASSSYFYNKACSCIACCTSSP